MPDLTDHLSHLLAVLEARYDSWEPARRAYTGLPQLDAVSGGAGPGGWLIRGDPGSGTTALLTTFVTTLARHRRRPVVRLVTTTATAHEVTIRLVASVAGISVDRLRAADMLPAEWKRLSFAIGALSDADIQIVETNGWTQAELELWCVDQRPAPHLPVDSWLVIDAIDRLAHPGLVSLPRLERLAGRYVVATTGRAREDLNAAALVTTLTTDERGGRHLRVDRAPRREHQGARLRLELDPESLLLGERPPPVPPVVT